jgi:hypothetical protein
LWLPRRSPRLVPSVPQLSCPVLLKLPTVLLRLIVDGLTTSAATGTALGLATAGTKTVLRQGSTGHGADIGGAALAENQILVAANSAHASHPYTAGELVMRIRYR